VNNNYLTSGVLKGGVIMEFSNSSQVGPGFARNMGCFSEFSGVLENGFDPAEVDL